MAHLHIAGLAIFAGPPPAYEELVGLLEAKLHLIPRYRQRVRSVPLELGRPVWVDDPHFDLGYHVRRTALPRPGDDGVLCDLMARLMGQPLDRNRPLWEAWLVEGLDDDRHAFPPYEAAPVVRRAALQEPTGLGPGLDRPGLRTPPVRP